MNDTIPCRRHSKLGAPIADLRNVMLHEPERLEGITGLLVHSNCDSKDFRELLTTVEHLDRLLGPLLAKLEWINLGGGYLFHEPSVLEPLCDAVSMLRSKYDLEVYVELGASISRRAGSLVATVLDVFPSDGRTVVILDASVNHVPEIFEFQDEPDVRGDVKLAGHRYILAGATCLAGDIFGEYGFAEPLQVGSKVVFENIGAYSMVKAQMFNGVNLPSIYSRRADGTYDLKKRFTYQEFRTHLGSE